MKNESYKVTVPENKSGDWAIQKYTVNNKEDRIRQLSDLFSSGRYVPAGTYTRLLYCNQIIMSDTPDEYNDHRPFIRLANGSVLIAGLGLGLAIQAVGRKDEVKKITVIEKSKDVIQLVGNHYLNMFPGKLIIINADIFEWKTSEFFDYAWYDIWSNICTDNYEEMKKLHRKFGRKTGWQDSWSRHIIKGLIREEKRNNFWRNIFKENRKQAIDLREKFNELEKVKNDRE